MLSALGIECDFVQHNQSLSAAKGVVRGLHFQTPPHAQAKLLRVNRGCDLRRRRRHPPRLATYGHHVGVTLKAEDWTEIFIPDGFAHGFCTLTPDTEIVYKVSRYYAPSHDKGLAWDDPALRHRMAGAAWRGRSLGQGPQSPDPCGAAGLFQLRGDAAADGRRLKAG